MAKMPRKIKMTEGSRRTRDRELARGHAVLRDRGRRRERVSVKVRTGSFTSMGIIDVLSRGLMIADLVALIASLDVVAPEIDR